MVRILIVDELRLSSTSGTNGTSHLLNHVLHMQKMPQLHESNIEGSAGMIRGCDQLNMKRLLLCCASFNDYRKSVNNSL